MGGSITSTLAAVEKRYGRDGIAGGGAGGEKLVKTHSGSGTPPVSPPQGKNGGEWYRFGTGLFNGFRQGNGGGAGAVGGPSVQLYWRKRWRRSINSNFRFTSTYAGGGGGAVTSSSR